MSIVPCVERRLINSSPNIWFHSEKHSHVLTSATQTGTNAEINFNLDAADGENDQYRVEFFSNDTPDPSGYGEGQTFLGSTTVTNVSTSTG